MSQSLYQYLLSSSYQLLFTDAVLEAKQILETNDIDCIILDLSLAGEEDGLVLARMIRQEQNNHKLPIIAVTAHAFPSDRQRALDAGCNAYLPKPIHGDKLIESIANLLSE